MPSPGDIVLYCLTESDARKANANRAHGQRVARIPLLRGVQRHHGPEHIAGEVCPLLVIQSFKDGLEISGQAFLRGNDSVWIENSPLMTAQAAGCWMLRQGSMAPSQMGDVFVPLPWHWSLLRWALCRRRV